MTVSASADVQTLVVQLQQRLQALEDRDAIRSLLDRYTALHDKAFNDRTARQQWQDLFVEDAEVAYAFGKYQGREGLGDWAWGPSVSTYAQCHLQSSNFDISLKEGDGLAEEDKRVAFVRSNCITHWLYDAGVLNEHFDAGGVYEWMMVKEGSVWRIKKLDLKVAWTYGFDLAGVSRAGTI